MKSVKSVDEYIEKNSHWSESLKLLRNLILSQGLNETIKWGAPIYTVNGKNVVGLGAFKSYVGIWFHQGVLLKDMQKKLLNAQEGVTRALRQWRFQSLEEIERDAEVIRAYVQEAVQNQKSGKEIKPLRAKKMAETPELAEYLARNPRIKEQFEKLTPGRQREYAEYIATAKRAGTRQARLEKIAPMIAEGIGLNDRYKK